MNVNDFAKKVKPIVEELRNEFPHLPQETIYVMASIYLTWREE